MKIALSLTALLFLLGCNDNNANTKSEVTHQAAAKTEVVKEVTKQVAKVAPKKEEVQKAVKHTVDAAKAVQEKAAAESKKVVEKAKKAVVETKKAATETKKAVTTAVSKATTVDAAKLFVTCSSCHGQHAEKKALGKSQVIAGWEASKIETALKGYKAGTYGGAMKAVMKGQASKLSDDQIKALAEYISKF
jgi:cytochrome c553